MANSKSRYYQNFDKRLAAYTAQRELEEAAIAKRRAAELAANPAPTRAKAKATTITNGAMPELAKRLRF